VTCPHCSGIGVVIDEHQTYACHCEAGAKAREPWYFPSDKARVSPVHLKVWPRPGEAKVLPLTGRDRAAGERPEDEDDCA
jgi:hypothetical protein